MIKLVAISLVVACFLVFTSGILLARPNFVPSAPSTPPPPPPPPPQTFQPPISFVQLDAETVFDALSREELAEEPVLVEGTKKNKFKFKRQIQFTYMDFKGYICEFDFEKDFYAAQEETLDMNEKGAPYTWSIAQDNIILVLDGKLPEEEFLKFQEVLRSLNK